VFGVLLGVLVLPPVWRAVMRVGGVLGVPEVYRPFVPIGAAILFFGGVSVTLHW
jgi:hypothetical protein